MKGIDTASTLVYTDLVDIISILYFIVPLRHSTRTIVFILKARIIQRVENGSGNTEPLCLANAV